MFSRINFLAIMYAVLLTARKANLLRLNRNRLNLTRGLQFFDKCYVHLIQAHFEIVEASIHNYHGSYELEPVRFPVVLNRYDFRIQRYPNWSRLEEFGKPKPCIKLNATLDENSWQKFSVPVPQQKRRQQCTVIFYVDPPLCDGPPLPQSPPGFTFTLHNERTPHSRLCKMNPGDIDPIFTYVVDLDE